MITKRLVPSLRVEISSSTLKQALVTALDPTPAPDDAAVLRRQFMVGHAHQADGPRQRIQRFDVADAAACIAFAQRGVEQRIARAVKTPSNLKGP